MKYLKSLFFVICIIVSVNGRADCKSDLIKLFSYPRIKLNGESGEQERLASMIRNQAENILNDRINSVTNNLEWHRDSNIYYSTYQNNPAGRKIELAFSVEGILFGYKISEGKKSDYHCIAIRQLDSINTTKKKSKGK